MSLEPGHRFQVLLEHSPCLRVHLPIDSQRSCVSLDGTADSSKILDG